MDRDGVLNLERGNYTSSVQDFKILEGVQEALKLLKDKNFLLIVITNQAGISKGLYTTEDVKNCHNFLQKEVGDVIDAIYYCPYHPEQTNSLARKPGSLMFEKAIAKFDISPEKAFMIGDKERDLIPARKLGVKTILISKKENSPYADHKTGSLLSAAKLILEYGI